MKLFLLFCLVTIIACDCQKKEAPGLSNTDSVKLIFQNESNRLFYQAKQAYYKNHNPQLAQKLLKQTITRCGSGDSILIDSAFQLNTSILRELFFQPDSSRNMITRIIKIDSADEEVQIDVMISNRSKDTLQFTEDYFFLVNYLQSKIKPQPTDRTFRIAPRDSLLANLLFQHLDNSWHTFVFIYPSKKTEIRKKFRE